MAVQRVARPPHPLLIAPASSEDESSAPYLSRIAFSLEIFQSTTKFSLEAAALLLGMRGPLPGERVRLRRRGER